MAEKEHGVWASLRDRWEFATHNDEQKYQTKLYSDRRLYNQILSYPSNYIQNRLLRPDLKPKGWFDQAAAFTFVDKWLFGSVGGMVARSMTSGYTKHENYTRAKDAATHLAGLAIAAEELEPNATHLSDEIAAGQGSILNTLFTQSAEAGHVLEQFISGKLAITPGNVEKLNTLLTGLAELANQRAEVMEATQSLTQQPDKAHTPSAYIREAVEKPQLESLRDAQVFMGFVSSLLADSAIPFSSEIYIPQEEVFLTEEQNKELSKAISARLEELGYVPNSAGKEGEARPMPNAPEGVLLKRNGEGYAPLSKQEVLGFAQEVHTQLQALMGKDMTKVLDFADARFADIENTLAHGKAAKAAATATPEIALAAAPQITAAASAAKFKREGHAGRDMLHLAKAGKDFMTRPHMRTEISKLWGRSVSNQIMAFPVNIFDEVLRNFFRTSKEGKPKAGFDVMMDRLRGNKDSEMGKLFDADAFQNNLKSRGFRFVAQSLIASVGVVTTQQSTRVGDMLAVDAERRADPILSAAIRRGQAYVPEFAKRVQDVKGQHPSLAALMQHPDYKDRIAPLLSGKHSQMSADDFRLLGQFFHDMSQVSVNMAEEVLSPFQTEKTGTHKLQSMDEVAARLFDKPLTSVPDAMMALAFAQSFMQLSKEKIEMIEYVDPDSVIIKSGQMKEMGYFIADKAKQLGLKEQDGELVGKDGKPASAEAVIALGQATIGKLNSIVNVHMLIGATQGNFRDEVVEHMENRLFEGVTFGTQEQQATPTPAPAAAVEPWAGKVHRPTKGAFTNIMERWKHPEVKHEKQKLFDRLQGEKLTSTVSTLIQKSLQHQNSVLDRGNLVYTAWTYAAYPTLYGKGIVNVREVWDELLSHKRSMLNDAGQAAGIAQAAVVAAGQAAPDLKERLAQSTTANMLVEEMQGDFQTRDIARIAAKPRKERTPEDDAAMESYFAQSGEQMLKLTGEMLTQLGQKGANKETFRDTIERVCDQPVNTLADAMVGLSFLSTVIARDADSLDRQTFVDPKDIMLRKEVLGALGEYMSDQAYAAGFAVNGQALPGAKDAAVKLDGVPEGTLLEKDGQGSYRAASEENIIRYANVALDKFRDLRAKNPDMAEAFTHQLRDDKQQRAVLATKQTAALQL